MLTGSAVRLACPRLQNLKLRLAKAVDNEDEDEGEEGICITLEDILTPLCGAALPQVCGSMGHYYPLG